MHCSMVWIYQVSGLAHKTFLRSAHEKLILVVRISSWRILGTRGLKVLIFIRRHCPRRVCRMEDWTVQTWRARNWTTQFFPIVRFGVQICRMRPWLGQSSTDVILIALIWKRRILSEQA